MIYFSKQICGFYDDEIHAPQHIPVDAVPITVGQHQEMLEHLNNGGRIEFGGDDFVFMPTPPDAYHAWNDATQAWETNTALQAKKLMDWRNNLAEITPKQLRLVLLENGINSIKVEAAIASIENETTREVASIEWNYATGYKRTNENLVMIATELLGLTEEQIDAMWLDALTK